MTRTRRLSWLVLAFSVSIATPALADSFLVYTETGLPVGSDLWTWCDLGQPCPTEELQACGAPEGSHVLRSSGNVWAGMGVFLNLDPLNIPQPEDLSAFANGDIRFVVKAPDAGIGPYELKVEFQCRVNSVVTTYTTFVTDHGWDGTSAWQELSIPIASFFAPDPVDQQCLESVISPFMITIANLPSFNSFFVDHVRWQSPNSHAGASSVQVQGRQLLVDGEPFVVNGAAYAPISICENYAGGLRDRPDRYLVDFPLMAAQGINTVRIYSTFLTTAMLDAAWAEGLYVIPTFQVDTLQNQCAPGQAFMADRFVEVVEDWKDHPAILMWVVGNEINAELTDLEMCQDWYPQLDALAQAAHAAEGASFHPVTTANADLDDICVAGCSDDTTLPNLDLWMTNVYRGCSMTSALTEYAQRADCDRPLVIGEFGTDAWDGVLGAESEGLQEVCLEGQLDDLDQGLAVRTPGGVSTGQIVFEWTDEWWKAEPTAGGDCVTTDWCLHDTCKNSDNFAYPDPAFNEEWFGIVAVDAADPAARTLRAGAGAIRDAWLIGAVEDLEVVSHAPGSGNTSMTFDPAPGSTDHVVHYGPLSAVSSYGYTGSATGLGGTGSGSFLLPNGSLFWVVVGRDNGAEGCYGNDSSCSERPRDAGSALPQAVNRSCRTVECP